MPYYSVTIEKKCYAQGCNKTATQEVRSPFNDTMGFYCSPHAKRRVADLNEGQ